MRPNSLLGVCRDSVGERQQTLMRELWRLEDAPVRSHFHEHLSRCVNGDLGRLRQAQETAERTHELAHHHVARERVAAINGL